MLCVGRRDDLKPPLTMTGEQIATARRWTGPLAAAVLLLFAGNTVLVLTGVIRASFDIPVERALQSAPWGPLTQWMMLTNATDALAQGLVGAAVVVGLLIWNRRAAALMALGSIAVLMGQVIKVLIHRHPPPLDGFAVHDAPTGFSYPSGHAVFFTWLSFMLVAVVSPSLRPGWRLLISILAGVQIALACIGRVWVGVHWPTDVIGGFLLALGWCLLVLWLAERRRPHA
jgi:membrane-associated phospholipid phosphatase